MKKLVKLTESDLHAIVEDAAMNVLNNLKKNDEQEDEFNEQPTNDLVGEGQIKVNESQLFDIIRESVHQILKESGDKHRFGLGKYGLAMDAARKARSLGRFDQSDNLMRHGKDAFNQEYGTNEFDMDDFGRVNYNDGKGNRLIYRPASTMKHYKEKADQHYDGMDKAFREYSRENGEIKNAARTAKAFPRKKMTGGLDAVDKLDAQLNQGI